MWISNSWKNTGWNCSNQRFRNLIIFTHIHHVLDIQNRLIVTECISIVYFVKNSEFMYCRISQSYLHIKENIHILQFNKNVFQFKTVHYHVLKYESTWSRGNIFECLMYRINSINYCSHIIYDIPPGKVLLGYIPT